MHCMDKDVPAQMLLHQILRMMTARAERLLEEYHLKKGQAGILFLLEVHGGVSQRELADMLGVKPPSITVALQKMEKQGYITRKADEKDQRVIRIHSTQKGSDCVEHIKEVFRQMEEVIYDGISREEVLLLRRLLKQIRDNLLREEDIKEDFMKAEFRKTEFRKTEFRKD